jgi:hypothetical protein
MMSSIAWQRRACLFLSDLLFFCFVFFFYMASYKIKMDYLAYMCSKAEKLISHGFLIIFVKLKYFGSFICLFIVSIINIH